jgi:hypothetical protein
MAVRTASFKYHRAAARICDTRCKYVENSPLRHFTLSIDVNASYANLEASDSSDCWAFIIGFILEETIEMMIEETGIPAIVTKATFHDM